MLYVHNHARTRTPHARGARVVNTNDRAGKGGVPLTVRDVCAELRLSRNTVYALIASGQLAAFRAGKQRYRIEPDDLRRYKEARRAARTNPDDH